MEVVRKDIRNLHLGVYPPNGRVRVAAPVRMDDDAVRLAVISRLQWVRTQRARFENQLRQSMREFVTGESHYVQGRRFRLDVIEQEGSSTVALRNNATLQMSIPPGTDPRQREAVLQKWYRSRLRERLPALLAKWEAKVGVSIAEVRIRRMKTRWGSCNADARRIWLNLELAKKPAACLEYILVHEMVHVLERHHSERFQKLMDAVMPSWRIHRDELNRAPLAHEDWAY